MLSDEDRMPTKGRLPAVVGGMRQRQSFRDEAPGVLLDHVEALLLQVGAFPRAEGESRAEAGSAQRAEKVVEVSQSFLLPQVVQQAPCRVPAAAALRPDPCIADRAGSGRSAARASSDHSPMAHDAAAQHLEDAREALWEALQLVESAQRIVFRAGDCYVGDVWGAGVRSVIDVTEAMAEVSGDLSALHIELGKLVQRDRARGG